MTTPQALFIGLLQGATELFPVSSLGHAVILPTLLHWNFDQGSKTFLPFLVLLHLGTATALLILYREDWVRIVAGFFRAAFRGRVEGPDERLAMLLALGTIPGGAIGKLFIEPLTRNFANARLAAAMLVVNGGILLGAELLRRRSERAREEGRRDAGSILATDRAGGPPRKISREEQETDFKQMGQISFHAAAIVGLFQAVALVPGISRSGITMAGGLVAGLRHTDAAKFSFLLATPIIFAAGALEVPVLFQQNPPLGGSTLEVYLASAVLAGVAAYLSARFLVRYFRSGRLDPYGVYCVVAGLASLILLR